jgi:periplasmic protein TonB
MPPSIKENAISTARPEASQKSSSPSTSNGETTIKQQPVALEVPVSVNGARAVDGSDKREPFSESTKTVLIFGSGAVIRLSSSVAPGQLLFLTNEKTKKEVVCQVVKSKNYRNVSGYVELEFTEPVVGFWGMRFPSDRIGSAPQAAPPAPAAINPPAASGSPAAPRPIAPSIVTVKAAVPVPAAKVAEPKVAEPKSIPGAPKLEELLPQKPVAPAVPLASSLSTSFDPEAPLTPRSVPPPQPVVPVAPVAPISTTPQFKVEPAPAQPFIPASVPLDAPRAESQASLLEPAKTPSVPPSAVIPNLLSLFESKPAAPAADDEPAVQVFVDPETETLKQHTARLQGQLANMAFSEEPSKSETVSAQIPHTPAVIIQKELADKAASVLEQSNIHKPEPTPVAPAKLVPPPTKSSLDDEELKIPAWLEPLARNAAVPSSTQELIEREKTKRLAEQPEAQEIAAEIATTTEEFKLPELPLPTFGDDLPLEEEGAARESGSRSSNKGLLIGALAASVLLLAGGGWWYRQRQSGGIPAGTAAASNVQASVTSLPVASLPSQSQGTALPQTNPPAASSPPALTNASSPSSSASNTSRAVPAVSSAVTARNSQPTSSPVSSGRAAKAAAASPQPAAEQPKKPILGEVHLLKPKVSPGHRTQNVGEPDAVIPLTSDEQPAAEGLNAGIAAGNAQPSAPAAPLAIGGDVKQAKLISSVPPAYPSLAKTQHVSGNVQIDALIDATGRVTTMKVVSGPTLLQQAAMDALKQWKYQPATLDGKPVPMHLTVTLQFRLQ